MFTNRNITLAVVTFGIGVIGIFAYIFLIATPSQGEPSNEGSFFGTLFPFSSQPATNNSGATNTVTDSGGEAPVLRQVSSGPVSGGAVMAQGVIRYMERDTGHVYETPVAILTRTRVANTTIPGIQESLWGTNGLFILRTIEDDTITTLIGRLASSTPEQALQAQPITTYDNGVMTSDGKTLWAVVKTPQGSHADLIDLSGTQKPVTLYTSQLSGWIPLASKNELYLQNAPSSGVSGSLYKVSRERTLERLLGNVPGLIALPSPSGRYVLYSSANGASISTWMLDYSTNEIKKMPLATLATKCAFIPNAEPQVFCGVPSQSSTGNLPDTWLLGMTSFTDRAWLMNSETGVATAASDLSYDASQEIDVYRPSVSEDGVYALFINKNDLTLWSLKLK